MTEFLFLIKHKLGLNRRRRDIPGSKNFWEKIDVNYFL